MSRRNTRDGKAWRRAERERRRPSMTSGQGPRTVEVQAAPRPDGLGSPRHCLGELSRHTPEGSLVQLGQHFTNDPCGLMSREWFAAFGLCDLGGKVFDRMNTTN